MCDCADMMGAALSACIAGTGPQICCRAGDTTTAYPSPSITSTPPFVPEGPSPRSTMTTCKRLTSSICAEAALRVQVAPRRSGSQMRVLLPPPVTYAWLHNTQAWHARHTSSKYGAATAAAKMPATLPPMTTARLTPLRTGVLACCADASA